MKAIPVAVLISTLLAAWALPLASFAAPRDDLLASYANAAKATAPTFSEFSAARGEKLYAAKFTGGKPDTPSCTTCHGDNPRAAGHSPAGKAIDAVAVSATPTRYTDAAKVEKWFKRNCTEVLGRECTPLEKGDWLSYMISQ